MLPAEVFATVISSTPLISVDLLIVNTRGELLLGKRNNKPAQGSWFVPGGRVFKNESIAQAISRISQSELGVSLAQKNGSFKGHFEHFYQDSVINDDIDTHYVVLAYHYEVSDDLVISPCSQHIELSWHRPSDVQTSEDVHCYTKAYLEYIGC